MLGHQAGMILEAVSVSFLICSVYLYLLLSLRISLSHKQKDVFLLGMLMGFCLVWTANLCFKVFHLFSQQTSEMLNIAGTLFLALLCIGLTYQHWYQMLTSL